MDLKIYNKEDKSTLRVAMKLYTQNDMQKMQESFQ